MTGFGGSAPALPPSVLAARANPVAAGVQEVIPYVFFDTQTYVSGTTRVLSFFTSLPSPPDPTLSNMPQAGALPYPFRFQVRQVCCDVWRSQIGVTDGAGGVGRLNDTDLLTFSSRPVWQLRINQKSYGQFPLTFLHASGGPWGVLSRAAGAGGTIDNIASYGRITDAPGWTYDDMVILSPQEPFEVEVTWPAAVILSGNMFMRISLVGILNRKVQ